MNRGRPPKASSLAVRPATEKAGNDPAAILASADPGLAISPEIFIAVGRIETARFYETVSSRLIAEQYLKVKALIGKGPILYRDEITGEAKRVSSLDEFCETFLGRSQRRCQQVVADLALLGDELYETAQTLGFKARDYQVLRSFPADAQQAVKEALASDSRDTALELVHEFARRVEAAKGTASRLEQELTSRQRLLDEERDKSDRMRDKLERLSNPGAESTEASANEQKQLSDIEDARIRVGVAFEALAALACKLLAGRPTNAASLSARTAVEVACQNIADTLAARGLRVHIKHMVDGDVDLESFSNRERQPT